MRETSIARNYAEALLELASRARDLRGWGTLIQSVADAIERDQRLRAFLETPRVDAARKNAVFRKALSDTAPSRFVRFIESVVTHRRQMLLPSIAREYVDLVDQAENRLHASVTVAREPDEKTKTLIVDRLSRAFNKTVVPHVSVDSRIIGGIVVRVGDVVMDGSARRRLAVLKQRMIGR